MKFGPAEMAQMMDGGQALITVTFVSAACLGIVLGAIVALYHIFFRHRANHFRHHAADRSFQSEMPTVPAPPTVPALPNRTDASPHSPRPRANNLLRLRLVDLLGIIILIVVVGGGFFSTSRRSDFETTNNNQVGIQPLPPAAESQTESMILKQLGIRPLFPTKPPQQVPEVTSVQPNIQQLPEPPQQTPEVTSDQPVIQPLPSAIEPRQHFAAARDESINANLCEASSRRVIERTLSSAPTKELVKYVEGLKKGSYASTGRCRVVTLPDNSDLGVGLRSPTTKQWRKCGVVWHAKAVCTLTRSSNISVEFSARNKLLIVSQQTKTAILPR
jgi:hypothetical protein